MTVTVEVEERGEKREFTDLREGVKHLLRELDRGGPYE